MDIHDRETQTRRTRLREWISGRFPTVSAFAAHYGLNQSDISALLRNKSFGSRRARALERKVGMPSRYLEMEESDPARTGTQVLWPFEHSTYGDFQSLSPGKRRELDIRIAEFIAGAKQLKSESVPKKATKSRRLS